MHIVIVGGVAGGAACAARLRRLDENTKITIIEKGPYVSFANCGLPYFLSGVIADRDNLFVADKKLFEKRFNINVLDNTTVTSINRNNKYVNLQDKEKTLTLNYDVLILSPGSNAIVPPFASGIDGVFTLRTVPDVDAIKARIKSRNAKKVLVVGGGFIGLECAENLNHIGIEVTLAEGAPQVLPPFDFEMAQFVHQELKAHGVRLKLNSPITGISHDGDILKAEFKDGTFLFDAIILAIGGRPNSVLAKEAGLSLNDREFIKVNDFMQTSDPNIYALGDAVEINDPLLGGKTSIALAGPANKQARVLCSHLAKNRLNKDLQVFPYKGAMGASIVKVFGIEAASVGLNERSLKGKVDCDAVWLHPNQHAGYYPNAAQCHLKVIYDKKSFKLLGAQAVGAEAAKRIEIMSAYLSKNGSIDDLAYHEQVYAPPFSSARDGINYAGCILENIRDGLVKTARFDELNTRFKDAIFIDVRTPDEFKQRHIPGFINLPLDSLRQNLNTLNKDKEIVITCAVGIRGYNACRILNAYGFKTYNLSGGVLTYFTANFKA